MKRKEEDFEGKEYKKVYTKNFFIGLEIEKKPSESLATFFWVEGIDADDAQRMDRGVEC